MATIIVVAMALVMLFGFVVWVGAPYVPTLRPQAQAALKLLDLQPGQTLLELGSGDGRVAKTAAKAGIRVTCIELNPLFVIYSKLFTWRYRKLVTIHWGNMWTTRWPEEPDAIYVFLLDRFMPKLDKKITQKYSGKKIKLVSFAFQIPDRTPVKEREGIYLYQYK